MNCNLFPCWCCYSAFWALQVQFGVGQVVYCFQGMFCRAAIMHSSCVPRAQGCLCVCCVGAVASLTSDDCGDNVFLLCLRLCPMCMCARMIFTSKEVWCLWSTAGSASTTETGVAERTGPVSRCLENHCCVVEVKRNSLGIQCRD